MVGAAGKQRAHEGQESVWEGFGALKPQSPRAAHSRQCREHGGDGACVHAFAHPEGVRNRFGPELRRHRVVAAENEECQEQSGEGPEAHPDDAPASLQHHDDFEGALLAALRRAEGSFPEHVLAIGLACEKHHHASPS